MSKELHTLWKNNQWKMFALKYYRNPNSSNALIPIPEISKITRNPIYIKYIENQFNELQTTLYNDTRKQQQESNYRNKIAISLLIACVGILGLAISISSIMARIPGAVPLIELSISIILSITGLSFTIGFLKAQENYEREIELFETLVELKKNTEAAQKEIKIKNQCINQLIDWLESSAKINALSINSNDKHELFGQIATNFDSKDNLYFYKDILDTLVKISKGKSFISEKRNITTPSIENIINELIKANYASNYYQPSLNNLLTTAFKTTNNIYSLMNLIRNQHDFINSDTNSPLNFLYVNLGEILSNDAKLFTLKDIVTLFHQHCQLSLKTNPRCSHSSVIKLTYDALENISNYQDLQASIKLLTMQDFKSKSEKIVHYYNQLFNKNYDCFNAIFIENDINQLKENITTFVVILENKSYFHSLIMKHSTDYFSNNLFFNKNYPQKHSNEQENNNSEHKENSNLIIRQ